MAPKKKGRSTKSKAKVTPLSPEDQLKREKVDLFLKDFNHQCDLSLKEMWREKDAAVSCINMMYKLELMKLPKEVREMRWDDYYNQAIDAGKDPLALSKAITACLEDSICGQANAQGSQVKAAMQPAPEKRSKSNFSSTSSDVGSCKEVTVARKRLPPRSCKTMNTPANYPGPPIMGKTPMITPKFDTTKLSRTVSRVARADEVLVSLSGSPVVPSVAKKVGRVIVILC